MKGFLQPSRHTSRYLYAIPDGVSVMDILTDPCLGNVIPQLDWIIFPRYVRLSVCQSFSHLSLLAMRARSRYVNGVLEL